MTAEQFIEAIPMPCAIIGASERVIGMNSAAMALFGQATLGRHYAAVFRQPALLDNVDAVRGGQPHAIGRHVATGEARERVFDVTITQEQTTREIILAFADVTATEEAGEMRSEFVANVSHELRTPLTAISGFIETLRGPARNDEAARDQFLEIMEREARRMNRLVDDLLSLAKVEDLERMRPTDDADLTEIVSSAARSLGHMAAERGVALRLIGMDHAACMPADADQLTQVFTNLIENAIKYGGDGGEVTVSLDHLVNDPRLRGDGVMITVADTGEGIDERHVARLTERFYRVDSHRSRGMGGTGLGLAIVKHIVNRHRGRLRIESTLGQGSRFSVLLPKG